MLVYIMVRFMLMFLNTYILFLCSLGQACNHVAALLFYIEYYAHDDDMLLKNLGHPCP